MNELLRKRLDRKLESLDDERVYQVLDYIEFLESKYATRTPQAPSPLQRLAETVEDTLRAGKVSASTIRGAMDVMAGAGRMMDGLAAAGKAVVDQVAGTPPRPGEIVQKPAAGEDRAAAPPPDTPEGRTG